MKLALRAVGLDDLFHHSQPQTLGDAAFDLPEHAERIEGTTDILGSGYLHHFHQTEFGVDIDHGAMRYEGKRGMAIALAVFIEILGGAMVMLEGFVELEAGARLGGIDT